MCGPSQAARLLISDPQLWAWVEQQAGLRTHWRFQVWAHSWVFRCECSAGVSVVGAQSANLGARNRASGVCLGYLSHVHSPGAEGVEAQEARATEESSLNSR